MREDAEKKSSAKTWLLTIVKFGLPVGIVAYLVFAIEPEQWSSLRDSPKRYELLVLALVIGLSAVLLGYLRWWLLVRCHHIALTPMEGIRLGAIGFLLNFVSIGSVGGDLFKGYFLARRTPGQRIEVFATILVDRVVGLYGLLVVAAISLFVIGDSLSGNDVTYARMFVYGVCIAGAAFMIGVVAGGPLIDRMLEAVSDLPLVGTFIHRIADPLRAFRHHTVAFLIAIVMSATLHALLSMTIYFIAAGLYPTPPTLSEHMVIVPIANAVAGLPISLAGIGVFEGALDHLYKLLPESQTDVSGTIVGLVYEIVKILIAVIGIVFYWTGGRDIRESARETTT